MNTESNKSFQKNIDIRHTFPNNITCYRNYIDKESSTTRKKFIEIKSNRLILICNRLDNVGVQLGGTI